MGRINILSDETSNKIAAGEVVERPSSVVKELVENSIDAGAKNVNIEINEGGQKTLRIIDDGSGIHPDDVQKAFLPHATSKISIIDDVFKISTLGFRGEALASIASVSNTILKSKTEEFNYGREISISGGEINFISDTGINTGTVIEVNDLFFNVPARLKFLKSPVREVALISDIVSRLALANPQISFKLFSNGKKLIHTYGNGNLMDVIRNLYGKAISDNLIYFENHSDTTSIHGYVGTAEISRGSRNNQSIFVNKRYIRSKLITAAVENAFKSFLTINKFPFFIVYVDTYPEFIDVNIHPTKAEIKFRDDREIFKLIFDGVHNAIRSELKDSFEIPLDDNTYENPKYENFSYLDIADSGREFVDKKQVDLPIDLRGEINLSESSGINDLKIDRNQGSVYSGFSADSLDLQKESKDCHNQSEDSFSETSGSYKESLKEMPQNIEKAAKFPDLDIIGQFNNTYVLAQAMSELYIIDQHAAHEKVLFEKYRNTIENNEVTAQILLTPIVLELEIDNFAVYIENVEVFKNSGFAIELFGDNTITIREVPYVLGRLDIKGLFLEIIENLRNMGTGKTTEVKYNAIAKMACKSAVKANHSLSIEEIRTLIQELRYAEDPFNCPHGRPTIIKMGLYELEKRFKRVQ